MKNQKLKTSTLSTERLNELMRSESGTQKNKVQNELNKRNK